MKHSCNKFLSLHLALVFAYSLLPAPFAAEENETAYASATAEDIRVAPPDSHTNGLLRFDEPVKGSSSSISDLLNERCRELTKSESAPNGYDLYYISYISLSPTQGTLYDGYNAEGDPGAGVAGLQRYYYVDDDEDDATAVSNYRIGAIQFVPAASFTGQALITSYGYYLYTTTDEAGHRTTRQGNYSGRIYITVAKQVPGISYSTDGEAVRFSAEDFSVYSLATTGRTFRYVSFTLPDSAKGKLYYNYLDESIYDSAVSADGRYYRSDTPNISNVYFVPEPGYSGSFTIAFTGRNIAEVNISGNINITVTDYGPSHIGQSADGAFTYRVGSGAAVALGSSTAFADLSAEELGSDYKFTRIRFMDLPSASEGTLYTGGGAAVRLNADYSSGDVGSIRFEANYNYEGTVDVPFRGYAEKAGNTRFFDGTLHFIVSAGSGGGSAPLHYTVAPGKRVFFESSDFDNAARAEMGANYSLYRIRFTSLPPSSAGRLSYMSGSSITNASADTDYIHYNLSNLSFLAAEGFTGSVTIPFTGYSYAYFSSGYVPSGSRSFSGTVTISSTVEAAEEKASIGGAASTLVYYSSGPAVVLDRDTNRNSILTIASAALPGAPATFSLTRPDAEAGRLCLDFVSLSNYAPFESALSHPVADIPYVSFLPKAGFSGTTRISYTVSDAKGNSFTGNIQITVTPPARSTYFTDMGSAAWAVPAVDFFRSYGAVYGNSRTGFGPTADMRRGDFILLLSRAFAFPNAGAASFADVSADKYYAAAVASAKALGLLTGGASENFYPEGGISRQDAAVYLYRALRRVQAVTPGAASDLAAYRDAADVSPYAVEAMGALVRLGVFQGDYGRLYPQSTLTRAETMTILYYALT